MSYGIYRGSLSDDLLRYEIALACAGGKDKKCLIKGCNHGAAKHCAKRFICLEDQCPCLGLCIADE